MSTIKVDTIQTRAGASEISISTLKADTIQNTSGTSEIGIDALKGASSAGSMTVVGEGGSTTTNLQQGLTKMWIHFAGSGSQAVGDSFNHATITDDAVGRYTVNFTNNMGNTGYSGHYDAKALNNNSGEATYIQVFATGSCSIKHYENGTNYDSQENTVTLNGDLA